MTCFLLNLLKKMCTYDIIYAEILATQVLGFALCALSCACVIDGFAKMFVQAHIFAS